MSDGYVFDEWAVSCENPECGWCHATDQARTEREPVVSERVVRRRRWWRK